MDNKCHWDEETFVPCEDMKQNINNYNIKTYTSFKKSEDCHGCLETITECPYCKSILKNITYINKLSKEIKKFQIRNVDREGCGSFYYVKAPINSTLDQISDLINEKLTEEYQKDQSYRQFSFIGMPASRFKTNRKMKIIEQDILNHGAKRKGLKGTAYLCTTKFKGINIITGNKFEKESGYFNVEWKI